MIDVVFLDIMEFEKKVKGRLPIIKTYLNKDHSKSYLKVKHRGKTTIVTHDVIEMLGCEPAIISKTQTIYAAIAIDTRRRLNNGNSG
jgi:hypothetical protein